jgi:ABC-2 type transport system permease protein
MASKIDDPHLRPENGPPAPPSTRGPLEYAPSEMRPDEPSGARLVGLLGLCALVLGIFGLILNYSSTTPRLIGPTLSWMALLVGIASLLFHAARDPDVQVRRVYGLFLGFGGLALGVIISLLPLGPEKAVGGLFLPFGCFVMVVGLLFLLAFGRVEDEPRLRLATRYVPAGLGAVAIAIALVGGLIKTDFLVNPGLVLLVLGLAFVWSAIGLTGAHEPFGYSLALGLGGVGALMFLYGLLRSLIPWAVHALGWSEARSVPFFVPAGFLLMLVGLIYGLIALGICSENRLIVMTRRELSAIFYSPIAYLVLVGLVVVSWLAYLFFISALIQQSQRGEGLMEPIVSRYIVSLFPAIAMVFVVPVVTMRLFSEEKRTGTIDVLLSVPLTEWSVVLSKFLAALIFFLLLWVPWALFLVPLRVESGQEFDYRPLMGFLVVLVATGGTFCSMGLFFSSLTRNQIGAAVMTFMGMIVFLFFYFAGNFTTSSEWQAIFKHLSFIDLWIETLSGKLWLRDILLHLSFTAFFLTLTTKVLEARKWS